MKHTDSVMGKPEAPATIKSLDLKRGDKVYFFHQEDPDCWTNAKNRRKVIEFTVNSWSDNCDPVYGRRYGVIENGKTDPVFIYDRFFEKHNSVTPSCFLSREAAVQAVLDAGYEVEECEIEEENMKNINEMGDFIIAFCEKSDFEEAICRKQLLCLWTAYCLMRNYDVDTYSYDRDIAGVYHIISETKPETADWSDFESFYNYMSKNLV